MRAVFIEFDSNVTTELVVSGDSAHHLNVVRVKNNEEILVLNGLGMALKTVVESVSKSTIVLKITEKLIKPDQSGLSLAIACPKKDAFEDIVKMAVELGIKNIYPLKSKYSQYDYVPSERLSRILESALIQSNNFFMPLIHPQQTLENFVSTHNQTIYFFNSVSDETNKSTQKNHYDYGLLLIGPEAGFSSEEVELIRNSQKAQEIHLPTPILRAPTAFSAGVGFILSRI